ncbi:CCT motif [Musa troglodytarum]|nr:CCT motif [Musa troglodytarum]
MDYDDNDFQNQNFQLIEEDNDGFPQNLQSYAPPKFDIDDHFQAHLRFDSLSETGLLLGIQGEENNWIEEFSPRNTAAEFGSNSAQTSISGHDNIWFNVPTSESAQILVNSVEDNEMVSSQVMNTASETHAVEDSTNCETKSIVDTNSTLLADEFHNSVLESNEEVLKVDQVGVNSQTSSKENSEMGMDASSLDQKLHSTGKVEASQCTINEELASSSSDNSKVCLVVGEPFEAVQNNEPLDNASMNNSLLEDHRCDVNRDIEASPNFISCSTQDGASGVPTEIAGIGTCKMDSALFSEQKAEECYEVDMGERLEAQQSEKSQNETCFSLYGVCKVADQPFQHHTVDNNVSNVKASSDLVTPTDSLMLLNEGSSNSLFFKNSDEAIDYPVAVLNKDIRKKDESSALTKEVPSLAVGRDEKVEKNSVEVVSEDIPELCEAAGPVDFGHDVHEYASKHDYVQLQSTSSNASKITSSEEERNLATSKPYIDDNNCSESRSSSDIAVRIELSTSLKAEIRMTGVDGDNNCRIDLVQQERSGKDECSKPIIEKASGQLDDSEHIILKKPCAVLLDDAENKISPSVHDKMAPMSDTSSLAEQKENNIIHLEEKEYIAPLIDSRDTNSKDCDSVIENAEFSSSKAQNTDEVMKSDKESVMNQADNPTILQHLHSEVEIVEPKEAASMPASCCNEKDVNISALSVIDSNADVEVSRQPLVVPASGGDGPPNKSDGSETANSDGFQLASSAGVTSFAACQSTEGKGGNQSLSEPSCGSPTVISCSNSSLLNPAGPASVTAKNSDSLKCTVQDSKVSTPSEDEGNFTFAVQPDADLSKKDTKKDWEPIHHLHSFDQPQISQENSQQHLNETKKASASIISKTTVEDKRKQVSARATRKVGNSKGDTKEKLQEKHGRGRKKNPVSTSPFPDSATRNKTHTEGIQQSLYIETNNTRSSCSPCIQTSNLPDLNTSVPSALLHQPFTDLQQIQLRAQIFVYGSLIQGVMPDEACMIPAFGGSEDGGRSLWERAWRVASERFYNQKSSPSTSDTHLHYHTGISGNPLQSKALNSPAGWSDVKFPNSTIQGSTVSLQSPFQSSSKEVLSSSILRGIHLESNQSLSPLHSYQTSHIRQYLNNATPLLSQSPCPGASSLSSQSLSFDSSAQNSAKPVSETTQVATLRDSSKSCASNMQLAFPGVSLPNQVAKSVSAASVVPVETQNRAATLSTKNASVSEKSRKKKKVSAPEELEPKFSIAQPQVESASAAVITNYIATSGCLSLSSNSPSNATSGGLALNASHPITLPYSRILSSGDTQQRVVLNETCTQIEHSKQQAENASAYAAAAVRHSQIIWEQMVVQRNSGLVSELEKKLASAAVAAAAAASVAKAAAEVAKVASEAAIQAKFMGDEALNFASTGRTTKNSEVSLETGKHLLSSTPGSISNGKDKICGPCSIISTAQKTIRKRVEASSAAIKRAENLDAILKAAEMVAEAVSQAGMIVSMGEPLPFSISELVEAGPEGHWRRHSATMGNMTEAIDVQVRENCDLDVASDHEIVAQQSNEQSSNHNERRKVSNTDEMPPGNKNYGSKLGSGSKTILTERPTRDSLQGSSIQKGSLVEVVVDEGGLSRAWFSAWVVDVEDGKAQVCYKDLSKKGHDKLEWIPLASEGDKPPRIRMAHPIIVAKSEGTRKRGREVSGNFTWAVGDRVDAWIHDGWWEGIVTEKSQDDETKLTVQFPAGGDSSAVRAWNLRHSLIWKDGQWIEWSHEKDRVTLEPYEGDTPNEKRQKLGQVDANNKSEIAEGEMGTMSTNVHTDGSRKLEESRQLGTLGKDVIISFGNDVGGANNTDALKVRRAGLQKIGSKKMVFGVPKPGKKRKFMEVSKHYTKDKTEKATEKTDSVKSVNSLLPQASQSWRNISKVDVKGKRATNLSTRGQKSLKSQNVQIRSTVDKEKLPVTTASVLNGEKSSLRTTFSNEEKKMSMEIGSFSQLGRVDMPVVGSSVPCIPSFKMNSSSVEAEVGEKGNVLSVVDKSNSSESEAYENPGKRSADVIEPRRSNRRIQPTSRLLEGLQSSLIIPKSPAVTYDRDAKTMHRGVTASRGTSHG